MTLQKVLGLICGNDRAQILRKLQGSFASSCMFLSKNNAELTGLICCRKYRAHLWEMTCKIKHHVGLRHTTHTLSLTHICATLTHTLSFTHTCATHTHTLSLSHICATHTHTLSLTHMCARCRAEGLVGIEWIYTWRTCVCVRERVCVWRRCVCV